MLRFVIGTSEMLLTSKIKQNWWQQSLEGQVQNIRFFSIADRQSNLNNKIVVICWE